MQQLATRSEGLRVYPAWAVLCQWEVAEELEGAEWAPRSRGCPTPGGGPQRCSVHSQPLASLLWHKVSSGGRSCPSLGAYGRHQVVALCGSDGKAWRAGKQRSVVQRAGGLCPWWTEMLMPLFRNILEARQWSEQELCIVSSTLSGSGESPCTAGSWTLKMSMSALRGPHVTLRASVWLATWPLSEAVTTLTTRQVEWGCLGHGQGGRLGEWLDLCTPSFPSLHPAPSPLGPLPHWGPFPPEGPFPTGALTLTIFGPVTQPGCSHVTGLCRETTNEPHPIFRELRQWCFKPRAHLIPTVGVCQEMGRAFRIFWCLVFLSCTYCHPPRFHPPRSCQHPPDTLSTPAPVSTYTCTQTHTTQLSMRT